MMIKLKKKKEVDITQWHRWFAWHPIVTEEREWIWLQCVQRRIQGNWEGSDAFYRLHNPLLLLVDPGPPKKTLVKPPPPPPPPRGKVGDPC